MAIILVREVFSGHPEKSLDVNENGLAYGQTR